MAANQRSLQITDLYRAQLAALGTQVAARLAGSWRQMNPDDLDSTFPAWLAAAAAVTTGAQRVALGLSGAYIAQFIAAETSTPPLAPIAVDPKPYIGLTQDGRAVDQALEPTLIEVKVRIRDGAEIEQALASGLARGSRISGNAIAYVSRGSLDNRINADHRIDGWRRVARPEACGACLAACTGAIQHESETLPCHDHCQCTKEPVVRDVDDRYRRPTGREVFDSKTPDEQNAMFAQSGGPEAADLIRTGQVPFEALVAHTPMEHFPDQITQQSLEGLLAHRS
jgi:hypothetical protein